MRPSRDRVFMDIARTFAERSTCTRGQVGAVIVKDGHIVAHGYNGAPPGQPHCTEVGCDVLTVQTIPQIHEPSLWKTDAPIPVSEIIELGCQRIIHAEANAVLYAARKGVSCEDARIYTTHEPCRKCAEAILACGIIEVYYAEPYRRGASKFLEAAGILCEQL